MMIELGVVVVVVQSSEGVCVCVEEKERRSSGGRSRFLKYLSVHLRSRLPGVSERLSRAFD